METGIVKHEPAVSTSVKICPQNGSPLVQPLSSQCVQAFFPWLPVETDSFNQAPAPGTRVRARHITLETYFNVKTLERIPWELVGRRRQELDFLKERKNDSPASLCTHLFVTRGTRGMGDIKGETHDFFFLLFSLSSVEKSKSYYCVNFFDN